MKVLVINAGSSSLKYQLIDMLNESVLAKGLAERIGIEGSKLKHKAKSVTPVIKNDYIKDHKTAIKMVLDVLVDPEHGVIESMDEIGAVGHRIVHGGEKFSESVVINDEVTQAINENAALAPLHNPANLMGIEACKENMPSKPQVAVFDTAFHHTMPEYAYLYGIPYKYYEDYKVRRYGFHGTSHMYISGRVANVMGKKVEDLKTIICHLGNGGSISAVKYGKSIDTTMGLTPLEGVLMGTRCGDLDPSIIEYIMETENKTIDEVMYILNKESGVLGVSGLSSDMRDIEEAMAKGHKGATVAYEMSCYRVKKYIGAYAAAMGGVDVIVFTAGIGENAPEMRADILKDFGFIGLEIDEVSNNRKEDLVRISTTDSKVAAFSIATNEELMIARDTKALVEQ